MRLIDAGLTAQDIKDKVSTYMMETYERYGFVAERGMGMYLCDDKGEAYLDFYAGIAVNSAGNCNDKVVLAVIDHTVLIDQEKCIGCQRCIDACPYGVRTYIPDENYVVKCSQCHQLTVNGEKPACVKNCPAACRFYGDLDDPDSDASKAIAEADPADVHRFADSGNQPAAAYILSDRIGTWEFDK